MFFLYNFVLKFIDENVNSVINPYGCDKLIFFVRMRRFDFGHDWYFILSLFKKIHEKIVYKVNTLKFIAVSFRETKSKKDKKKLNKRCMYF